LLGDIKGKSILHLQCHFGQDTISLTRLGAKATGVDISDKAIEAAIDIAAKTQSDAQFISCDIYDLPRLLDQQFDIVFTSYGTIGWLPNMDKWAAVVAKFIKPGGKFVFVEFHPVVFMFDQQFSDFEYNYFNTGPILETSDSSYTDANAPLNLQDVSWNHSMGEVVNSLIGNGLTIKSLLEYDYSPFNNFDGLVEVEPGKYKIDYIDNKLPMVYSIVATKS